MFTVVLGDKDSNRFSVQVAAKQTYTTEEVLRSEAIVAVTWLDWEISIRGQWNVIVASGLQQLFTVVNSCWFPTRK